MAAGETPPKIVKIDFLNQFSLNSRSNIEKYVFANLFVLAGERIVNKRKSVKISKLTVQIVVIRNMRNTEILEPPSQSPADKKSYRSIRLANGLTALLIEDVAGDGDKKLSAAALTVAVGDLHDPPSCPGLAHFCEHMLFMGSKKYPDENHFRTFIKRNGGRIRVVMRATGAIAPPR